MNANELADAMEIRASIRRKATSRKSVQENANDRLADQLDQAATMLRQQQAEIKDLKQQVAFLEDWRDTWRPFLKTIIEKAQDIELKLASDDQLKVFLKNKLPKIEHVLDYLKDK